MTRGLTEHQFQYNNITAEQIGVIMRAVLSNTRFAFNDQQFKQIKRLAMGSRHERMTITADMSICLFALYVDDFFIMTKDKAAAEKSLIRSTSNSATSNSPSNIPKATTS